MFIRSTRLNLVLSIVVVAAVGACGGGGGCGACATVGPLPAGGLPASQTVEGGAQIRVTQQGFDKILGIAEPLLRQQLDDSPGFCVPKGDVGRPSGGTLATGASYCSGNPSAACSPGCLVTVGLNDGGLAHTVKDRQTLTLDLSTHAATSLHVNGQIVGIGFSCTFGVTATNARATVDVGLGIDPATGELGVHVTDVRGVDLGLEFSGCSVFSSIANLADAIAGSFVDSFVTGLLRPNLDTLIRGFLPDPLGLVGRIDVGDLIPGVAARAPAVMETRIVPGGYVHLSGGGLSLGVITGLNADRDPATRAPGLASEPALCVPPLDAPRLGDPPTQLRPTPRASFGLDAVPAFDGSPADPPGDIALGLSSTTLALAGHHLVTSGALCLGIGTSFVSQLNLGTIGLLVPSLTTLASGQGNDPMLLVTRPQRAVTFALGDNTAASPAVTLGIDHLEVDFYAFVFERYVRAFTLDLTMNIGVNVELQQPAGGVATIQPTLVGISADQVKITVSNSEFIREPAAQLEAVLPSVFSLVTPLLGDLPEIALPAFAGFALDNPSIHHVTGAQGDFLGLYAQLTPSPQTLQAVGAAARQGFAAAARAAPEAAPVAASTGAARLIGVTTPPGEQVRAALQHAAGGALPRVAFDAAAADAAGRPLEWSYQLDGGMWRTWRPSPAGGPLVIEDAAFAWQGKYTIGLRSRVAGDYHTVSAVRRFPVIIDSVAPRFVVAKAQTTGDEYALPAFDVVSGEALQVAFGPPSSSVPASGWTDGATVQITREAAAAYADRDGGLAVYARDEAGNTARQLVTPFGAAPAEGGCAAGGAPGGGALVVVLLAGGLVLGRRRPLRRAARCAAAIALVACGGSHGGATPDAGPGSDAPPQCVAVAECSAADCARGELPFCVQGSCVCSADVPAGRVGPYSDVAVAADGTIWVSAYAQDHGDLVVARATGGRIAAEAWEWVDGVPAGPVTAPGSKIRGGIEEAGPDVGMYTSIAVGPDGAPMVSYFDRTAGALKLAQRIDGAWKVHVVDSAAGAQVGLYTSLTLRSDDGRPGIAYLAHRPDADGTRAEVRFAAAQSAHPSATGDWQFWVVDSAAVPATDPTASPLPAGTGLFVDAARGPDQAPVVAYYDRSAGLLKLSRFDVQAGQFAAPRVLDGGGGVDAGWSPSVAVDAGGVAHVAYATTTGSELKWLSDAAGAQPQVVDSGYRVDGTTVDGLPKPTFHLLGADAGLVLAPDGARIVYQDATTQELLIARQASDGSWSHASIAGATTPWPGGYGFFAAGAAGNGQLVISTWVVDLPATSVFDRDWVEVFSQPLGP